MAKIIMILVGCLEIILGFVFLIAVKFPAAAILFFVSGLLFIVSGLLSNTKKV